MVVYIKNGYIFLINLKCGYSTFENLRDLGIVKYTYNYNYPAFIITRDPYTRLVSFYKDKLIKNMTPDLTQLCQKELLKYFTKDELINKKISFERFIKSLAKGYMDDHVKPQYEVLQRTGHLRKRNGKLEFNYTSPPIYRIKLELGINQLSNILGINPDCYLSNETSNVGVNIVWTREMRRIVNILYAKDFLLLGYSMLP